MLRPSLRRTLLVGIPLILAAPLTLSTVLASIPDASGVIHACYTSGPSGRVRIIDDATASCNNNETAIAWNQAGSGPSGSASLFGYAHVSSTYDPLTNTRTYQFDVNRSKNVLSIQTVPTNAGVGGCITVSFEPKNIMLTGGGSFAPLVATRNAGLDQGSGGWSSPIANQDCGSTGANAYVQNLGSEAWMTFSQ